MAAQCIPPVVPVETGVVAVVSTAHLTEADNDLLCALARDTREFGDGEWIHFTGNGILVRLTGHTCPVTALKTLGVSREARRLTVWLMRHHHATMVHFESDAPLVGGFAVHDW